MEKVKELKRILDSSNNIVLFTGAGISVPSGIPDFRSATGLYSEKYGNIGPETIISNTFFHANPKTFYEYYKKHLVYKDALPNKAHYFFANLEKQGKLKAVVTQNIDNLHQAAGSKKVYELHGSVYRNYCISCNKFYDLDYIIESKDVPKCECSGIIKPDVVLYEEVLDSKVLNGAINAIKNSDCLVVVGTSLTVYPAAGLVQYFLGENLVVINKQTTQYDNYAKLVFNEDIISVIEKLENIR
ncbi:MAG TPA: NAD-dependent protein deacylase [Acholeplasmataceae bacterium]|nr:NAD-dependent protein deacylase [Acholeplasmataceae bacterium]